jgi:ABC-type taurine transport system ATPase subunit
VLIERIQIEDGFLDGLDVQFVDGLNVVIGARGTGKTSLIELIRFALGASAYTEDAARRGHQQALSVLQGGQVTLVVREGEDRFVVTRGSRDEAPRCAHPIPPATVLAQGEIEAVGAQPIGRLHLIDRFRPNKGEYDQRLNSLVAVLRSLTAEIGGVRDEFGLISEQIVGMQTVRRERADALVQQQDLLKSIEATAKDREELVGLQARAAVLGVQNAVYERTTTTLSTFRWELLRILDGIGEVEEWPDSAGENDLLAGVRARIAEALSTLRTTIGIVEIAAVEVQRLTEQNGADRLVTDDKARASRRALDQLQAGAGALARQVEILTEREAQLNTLGDLASDRAERIAELQRRRFEVFKELETLRSEQTKSRTEIANRINHDLRPEIKAEVIEAGTTGGYANLIAAELRGSGLHYNTLAPLLAARMSPLELVLAVESNAVQTVTEAAEITTERALNLIAHLRTRNLADIIAAPVDDAVGLSLLDGTEYKGSDSLSIGQRCTVVLPLLLSGNGELLIIDQPEDHLDNAFITDTLVERLRERQTGDQFIMASHNANIPVLGEADCVVRLGSDGRRGFVQHVGRLADPATVRAITSVMEGGVEAFERRAKFYHDVLGDGSG